MAHIEESGGDSGADVAHMHLGYIREEDQTEYIAKIISDFAKWVRFDWRTLDKKSEFPTLVRLMGCITDRNKHWKNQHSWFVALPNAVDIKVEHLKWDFTQKERIQHE
jgi:hypothetical protein